MTETPKSRRQQRVEQQKKTGRKWVAAGAAAVILLSGGAIAYVNMTGDKTPSTTSGQTVPAACSTTQSVSVATTESMATALKSMPVDEETCVTLDITTAKTAGDVVAESANESAGTNLWIPDSSVRAQLAMAESKTELTSIAESLAQSPGVLVSKKDTTFPNWLEALKSQETVGMGDPKVDPGAFSALMSSIAEAADGKVSVEDLATGTGLRAQSIGVAEPAQNAAELLQSVTSGTKDAAIVSEADYAFYSASHSDSDLKATVPGDGSFTLNYPLYKASTSTNTTVDKAAQQIVKFMESDEGHQALAQAGLRTSEGKAVNTDKNVGDYKALAPSNQEVLGQTWTSYSLQSAPLNALVVLDASGSMLDKVAGTDKTRMDITVESVLSGSQLFPARDSMGLWKFSHNLTTASGEVSDYEELVPVRGFEETVNGKTQRELLQEAGAGITATIKPEDQTALNDTLLAAFRSAKENYQNGSVNAVIMLTDGQDVHEVHENNYLSQEELISTIQSEQDPNKPVFFILIGISGESDMNALNSIAQGVGGEAHMASSPADIQLIFSDALTGITDAATKDAAAKK